VELAERDPREHRSIDRNREFTSIRQLDRDHIIDAEPERDEMYAHADSSFRHATVVRRRRYGTLLANRFKIG